MSYDDGLWAHQRVGSDMAVARDFAFFFEQGTGKTRTMITTLRKIFSKEGPKNTLIICPAIVVDNWSDEIHKYSKMGDLVQCLKGKKTERIKQLAAGLGGVGAKKIFVTNFEALDMEGLFWRKAVKSRIPIDHGFEIFISDESHRFKNASAKRTKTAINMADRIWRRYLLSGTPILNNEMDIWAQYRILDRGETFGKNFFSFRNEYFHDKNAGMPAQIHFPNFALRPGAAEKINERIYRKAYRVLKGECLDLPPFVEKTVHAEMSREQAKHYDSMYKHYITYLGEEACTASIALTRALRLQQIVSGFIPSDGGEGVELLGTPREKVLEELLADMTGQVIVWATWAPNYKTIARVCSKLNISYSMLTGQQSPKQKAETLASFKAGGSRVIIANPGAGGTGVNLIEADTAIWYTRSFSLEHRLQAQARNYRGGSERHKSIYQIDIVTRSTIDEAIVEALNNKEDISKNILKFSREMLDVS